MFWKAYSTIPALYDNVTLFAPRLFPGRWWRPKTERMLSQNPTGFLWKVLLKHSCSHAARFPNLIWSCFQTPTGQTDKTSRAPLLQLVCLESLQRWGANDSHADSLTGFAALQLCVSSACVELRWSWCGGQCITKAFPGWRKKKRGVSHICRRLKRSWEVLFHGVHGCTSASSGHEETSESTYSRQSLFSCSIAPICPPQDGVSLHTRICSYRQTRIHIQSCTPGSCPVQHV